MTALAEALAEALRRRAEAAQRAEQAKLVPAVRPVPPQPKPAERVPAHE